MRALLTVFFALCACGEGFVVAEDDAAEPVDGGERDVGRDAELDAELDGGPSVDTALADVSFTRDTAFADAARDARWTGEADAAGPTNELRLVAHQIRLADGFYEMNVLIAVISGASVSTAPEGLFLRFDGGVEVPGVSFIGPAANATCSDTLRVSDAGGLLCRVRFPAPVGLGVPVELVFVPNRQRFTAPVATCSAAAVIGRCDEEFLCVGGGCLPACATDAPGGWCFLQEACSEGACVASCSVFAPEGFCTSGSCVDGMCQ